MNSGGAGRTLRAEPRGEVQVGELRQRLRALVPRAREQRERVELVVAAVQQLHARHQRAEQLALTHTLELEARRQRARARARQRRQRAAQLRASDALS